MDNIIADVPGGANTHTYANIILKVELVRIHAIHTIWAGWEHASKKPHLSNILHSSVSPIRFTNPAMLLMYALRLGAPLLSRTLACCVLSGMLSTSGRSTTMRPER